MKNIVGGTMVKLTNIEKAEVTMQISFFEGSIDMLNRFIEYNNQTNKLTKEEMENIIKSSYDMIFNTLDSYKKKKAINNIIISRFKAFERKTKKLNK